MNHIYKSIFNKALGVFTAVPEFASAHGKGSERTVVGRVAKGTAGFAASALAISVGLALTSTSAVGYPGIYINDRQAGNCLAINDGAIPNLGVGTTLDVNLTPGSVVLRVPGTSTAPAGITPSYYNAAGSARPCVAVGGSTVDNRDTQTNRTLFYGGPGAATEADEVNNENNGAKNLTLGGRLDVNSGIIGVGDRGTNGAGATNSIRMGTGTTLADANKKLNSISIGVDTGASDANAIAIGANTSAAGSNSSAIGLNAKATTDSSIAIGTSSEAGGPATSAALLGTKAVAIGYETKALGTSNVALGYGSVAENGHDSIAIGIKTKTSNVKSIAIGAYSEASGAQSTVISNNYGSATGAVSTASGTRSQVYGAETNVSGNNSVAIGDTNKVASARTYAMGNNINVKAGINDALAFGTRASVQMAKSIAMGENATAGIDDGITTPYVRPSVAIGAEAKATGKGSVSIGHESASLGESATALGIQATALGKGQTSLGLHAGHSETGDQVNQQYGVFIGRYAGGDNQNPKVATEGGNIYGIAIGESAGRYGQGGNRNTAIGEQAGQYVKGSHNIALGTQAGKGTDTDKLEVSRTTAIGNTAKALTNDSVAIGTGAKSGKVDRFSGERSVAIGTHSEALGTGGIAIGDSAATTNGHNGVAIGVYSKTQNEKAISIGAFNKATGAQSIVIAGNYDLKNSDGVSVASGTRATVIGAETTVSGNNSVAIGDTNTIASARTYALGNNINVAAGADDSLVFGTRAAVGAANTVAIGANANAAQANSVALGAGSATSAPHTGAYTLNNSYTAAGLPVAANGTVSVGAAGKERQIQNVAAGVISATSTDAINGSQLYATNNYMNNFAGDVKTKLGGNAALGNDGHLTMTNIGGTGENTVDDAIKNLKTAIDNKADTTASVTSENQADIKVDKEAPVGNTTNYKLSLGNDAKAKLAKAATALQTVEGDSNITATKDATDPTKVKLALNKNLTADSLTLGDKAGDHAVVNKDGLTIANGPSVKKDGINAGNKKITGVANGNVAAGSTDAVNGGQLHDTNTKLDGVKAKADSAVQNVVSANPTALTATKAGDTVTLTPNVIAGDLVNPATGAVNTPAAGDAGKLVTAGTVANALANTHFVVDTAKTDGELDAASKHDQKIKSGNKVTLQAGKNLKAKQTNAADGATVEFSLKDSISLTQVTAGTGDNQVVLGNNGVQVGGNTYINKDGLNANNKPISNVADGVKPKDAVNKGQLDAVAQEAAKHTTVKAGQNVEVTEANNAAGGKEYTVKTADNLNVTSVKAGDSTLNTDGLTIAGGPSVKKDGINAGDKKITNVAPGTVAAGSKDAVNGGQLAEVKAKADSAVQNVVSTNPTALTATKAGDTVTLTPNFIAGDLVDPTTGAVNTPAAGDEGKLVSAKAVADALKANHFVVDTKANGGTTEAGSEADAKVGSSNKVAFEAGKNLVAKQTNTANGGATVKFSLQDDISLNSVTAGTGDNQVVLGNDGVKVGGKTYINNDGLNANDKKITNVAPGAVTPTSKDAVNGGQLYDVAKNVADLVGPDAKIDPATGKVSVADPTQGIGGTGKDNIGDAIKAVNATAAKHTTVVEGKNVKVTKGKNAAGGDEYTVATKDDLEVTSVTAGNTTVNTNGLTITGGPSVTRGGIDAGNRVISGVRAGDVSANSQEAVNGSQLHATNTKLDGVKAKADTAVQDVKSGDENALTAVKDPNTNIVTVTPKLSGDLVDANGNITAPTTPADKGKLVTAGTVADALANTHFVVDTKATDGELDAASQADQKIKAGNKVTLQAGKNLKAKQTNGTDGAKVEFSLKDSISLTQVTAGTGANQVVLGDDGVKVGGNTYINNDGLNANNKPISNVADGVNPKDAVNKGQLDAVKGVADSAVKSVDVANGEQNLVVDNSDPKNPKLSLKKDLTVDSVKAGDSTLNTDGLTIAGGPSVKKDGIDAGDKKITNVAPGAVTPTSKDAVNGSQLYNVANNVKDLIGPDAAIDPATGKVTVADPAQGIAGTGKGTIGEAIKSVKDKADTAVQDIKSGDEKALSVTKAGNTYTITPNLSGDLVDADGNITAPATDADKGKLVTAGTVAQALANTHFVVDTKATDGELDAASEADQKIKAGNKVTLQAGKNLKAKQTNGANGAQVEFSLKDSISLTQVTAGEGDNQVVLGNDGVKVGGNTYINKDGLNANNKPISNVADGVNPTDAVNKGQLDKVAGVADSAVKSVKAKDGEENLVVDNADPKNPKLSLKKDLTVDSVKAGDSTLNSDGLTIAGGPSVKKDGIDAGDKKITNVAPGAVTPTSKDAVNGSQLYNVANNVKDLIGPDAKIDPATGKVAVADPTKGIGETGKGTIGDAIKHVNDAAKAAADTAKKHSSVKAGDNIVVTEGTNAAGGKEYTVSTAKDLNVDSVKAGDTTVNNDGLTIAGGPSVKKDGIDAGDKNITNVADGNVAAGSKDAVNGGQLYDVAKNVADLVGPDATIDPATGKVTVADPTKGIGETGKGTIGDAIKAVNNLAKKAAAEKTSVKAKDGRSNVTVTEGTNAAGGHEYTVDVERAVTEAGSDQVTVTSKHDADSNTTTYTVDVSDKTKASLAKADSAVQGLTSKDGNLNFNKDPNGNVEVSFNDNLNVKNITADGVKAGNTTINSNGIEIVNGPSMTKDGINAAGKAISNVANGNVAKGSKDAVNGGQLHETAQSVADVIGGGATVKDGKVVAGQNGIGNTGQNTVHGAIAAINQNTANNFNQIRGDLRKMDRDLRGGIAGALATAGLPQAFRPGKSMVAAAASTYRGQSGLAIGVSRISDNGKVILKVTGNTNSRGDFGGTIGAGYQW